MIKISELYQVGIVVRDLDKSMEKYQSVFGIGPWEVLMTDSSAITDMTYHGRPVKHNFKIAVAPVGPVQLELIQPLEGETTYRDFLDVHGEGVHHLGHHMVDDLDETVRLLGKEGYVCVQSGRFPGGGYAYIDAVKAMGAIIEVVQMPRGVPAPGRR